MSALPETSEAPLFPEKIGELTAKECREFAKQRFPRPGPLQEVFFKVVWNWQKAAHVDRTGVRWLIKTAAEFTNDLAVSHKTIYRSLRKLEELGYIVKTQRPHLFDDRLGTDHCNWIALRHNRDHGYSSDRSPPRKSRAKSRSHETVPLSPSQVGTGSPHHFPSNTNSTKEPSSAIAVEQSNSSRCQGKVDTPSGKLLSKRTRSQPVAKSASDNRHTRVASALGPRQAMEAIREASVHVHPDEPPPTQSAKGSAHLRTFLAKMRKVGYNDSQIRCGLFGLVLKWPHFRAQVHRRTGRKLPDRLQTLWLPTLFDEVALFIPAGYPPSKTDAYAELSAWLDNAQSDEDLVDDYGSEGTGSFS